MPGVGSRHMKHGIICPKCATGFQVGAELLGKPVKCSKCGSRFLTTKSQITVAKPSPVPAALTNTLVAARPTQPKAPAAAAAVSNRPVAPGTKPVAQPLTAPIVPVTVAKVARQPEPTAGVQHVASPMARVTAAPMPARVQAVAKSDSGLADFIGEELARPQPAKSSSYLEEHHPQEDEPRMPPLPTARQRSPASGDSHFSKYGKPLGAGITAIAAIVGMVGARLVFRGATRAAVQAVMGDFGETASGDSRANDPNNPLPNPPPARPSLPPGLYESRLREGIALLNEMADLQASIIDRPTAQAAIGRMEQIARRCKTLAAEIQRIESGNQRSMAELQIADQLVPQLQAAKSRIDTEAARLKSLAAQLQIQDTLARVGNVGIGPPTPVTPPSIQRPAPHRVEPSGPKHRHQPRFRQSDQNR